MKIQMIDPKELKPYHLNPRINDHAVEDVARSLAENGFNQPIVVDQNMVICVGETRWKAATKLGLTKVPVYVKEMTEKEFIAYNLADNKTGEKADWDQDKLKENLFQLKEFNYKLENLGFNDKELMQIMNIDVGDLLNDADLVEEEISEQDLTVKDAEVKTTKQLMLFFNSDQLQNLLKICDELQADFGTENTSQTIYEAINAYYQSKALSN